MDQEDLLKHPHNKMEAPGRCCDAVDGKSEKVKATDNGYVVLIKEGSAHRGAQWLNCDREFCQKAASKKVTVGRAGPKPIIKVLCKLSTSSRGVASYKQG